MRNKIVLFSNMKGGTGKTTLLELFASYAIEKEVPVLAMDADPQLSLYKDRLDDLQVNPEASPSWLIKPIRVDENATAVIEKIKAVPGVVLIDCPGNIDNNYLQLLFKAADVVVMPFRYDRKNVRETATFCGIFKMVNNKAQIVFVPNMVKSICEKRGELVDARNMAYDAFGKLGFITARIMERVELECCNTLSLNYKQRFEVKYAFEKILQFIKKQ